MRIKLNFTRHVPIYFLFQKDEYSADLKYITTACQYSHTTRVCGVCNVYCVCNMYIVYHQTICRLRFV